jgi:hypothetical protein
MGGAPIAVEGCMGGAPIAVEGPGAPRGWWMDGEEGGGLIFNRAPALLRHSVCVFRAPRPIYKPRLPEKVGTPVRKAARVVLGGARPPPLAHRR